MDYTGPQKVFSPHPVEYRLTERAILFGNKKILLQGLYTWVCGTEAGEEWRDMKTNFELIR